MNNSSERKYQLDYVIPQYKLLFGKITSIDEVIDVASVALKAIGNKAQETFSLITKVKDYKVRFPCEIYSIKSVSLSALFNQDTLRNVDDFSMINTLAGGNMFPYNEVKDDKGNIIGIITYTQPEEASYNKNVVGRPRGKYIDFNNNGVDTLTFNVTDVEVEIIYKSPLLDDAGYPLVDEKTITAICYYINYLDIQRKYFAKVADVNMYQMALQLKDNRVASARIGEKFTKNQVDQLLDHAVSLGRKMYGLPNRV